MEDLPFIPSLRRRGLRGGAEITSFRFPPCEGGERGVVISSCIGISNIVSPLERGD